jgi:hypothetical protein
LFTTHTQVLKDGISAEEIADVRKSFVDMGIDVTELFKALDEMEVEKRDPPPPSPRVLHVTLLCSSSLGAKACFT